MHFCASKSSKTSRAFADGDMVKCAQSGFDEFVSKPLTVEKLLHRLYGVCKTTDRFPGLRNSNFALPS